MKEFKVFVQDKPGELARVTEALAARSVNIRAIASEGSKEQSFLRVVTNDVATTQKALEAAGLKFTLAEIVIMELLDRPGELSKVARRLARNGVNVESIYILGSKDGVTEIAIVASDVEKAKRAIG